MEEAHSKRVQHYDAHPAKKHGAQRNYVEVPAPIHAAETSESEHSGREGRQGDKGCNQLKTVPRPTKSRTRRVAQQESKKQQD